LKPRTRCKNRQWIFSNREGKTAMSEKTGSAGGHFARLAGRRALVTGGASGIGLACATALAQAGASVTIADLNKQAAEDTAQKLGGTAWAVDLADTKSLEELSIDTDILINNAGVQRVAPIHEYDPEAWRLIHRLMLESPFLLIRAALPGMRERGFGRIINISSIHGLRASAFKSAYVSAKHGLEGLSKVTALEGAEHGITSNCINPGYVRTLLASANRKLSRKSCSPKQPSNAWWSPTKSLHWQRGSAQMPPAWSPALPTPWMVAGVLNKPEALFLVKPVAFLGRRQQ
jgi:3-hydroxybutyrate dehydrogenase